MSDTEFERSDTNQILNDILDELKKINQNNDPVDPPKIIWVSSTVKQYSARVRFMVSGFVVNNSTAGVITCTLKVGTHTLFPITCPANTALYFPLPFTIDRSVTFNFDNALDFYLIAQVQEEN